MKSSLLKIGLMYFLVSIFVSVALAVAQWVLRPTFLAPVTEVLFVPGFFAAAVFLPTGIHSNTPYLYLALVFLLTGALYGLPILALLLRYRRRKRQNLHV